MTTFQKYASVFIVVCAMILVTGVCCKVSHRRGYNEGYSAFHPTDTFWRDRTIVKDSLVEVVKWKSKDKLVYVPIPDTVHHYDTAYVALPREFKQYADSTFEAQVSGIDPTLDWIKIHQRTAYITSYVEKSVPYKYAVSAFAEAGVVPGTRFYGRAGVQFEEQIAGPLRGYLRAGYEIGNINLGVFGEGGLRIDLMHK